MLTRKTGSTKWLAVAVASALLSGWTGAASADATAQLDRGTVALGERVQLKIRTQGNTLGAAPDLSPLANDFYVLGQSQSIRTTLINGQRDASVDWLIELTPLRTGVLEIPALSVGSESTENLQVTVTEEIRGTDPSERGTHDHPAPRNIRLSASVDRSDPYVQEQVALTLRLESNQAIQSGSLSEPQISNAMVEKLGEDVSQIEEIDGQPVYVFERNYAVFPQQSGELMIEPSVFDGELHNPEPRRSGGRQGFDPFGGSGMSAMMGGSLFDDFFGRSGSVFDSVFGSRGQPVRAISEPVQLRVRERPQNAMGERWLPAQDLELVELWGEGETQPPAFEVGEPVHRVVAVRARGVTASQLPIPNLTEVDGLKQYVEPAYEDSQEVDGGLVAVRVLPTVMIPTRAGSLTLPPVEVEWWDTQTNQPRTALIEARTVQVGPGRGGELAAAAALAPPVVLPEDPPSSPGPDLSLSASSSEPGNSSSAWMGLGLAGATALMGLLWHQRRRLPMAQVGADAVGRQLLRRRSDLALRQACAKGQAEVAEQALLTLGQLRWPDGPPIRSIGELASRLRNKELRTAIQTLSAHRYGDDTNQNWDGPALWKAYRVSGFGQWKESNRPSHWMPEVLPDLYPSR